MKNSNLKQKRKSKTQDITQDICSCEFGDDYKNSLLTIKGLMILEGKR